MIFFILFFAPSFCCCDFVMVVDLLCVCVTDWMECLKGLLEKE